jgi:DNA transformation protein and related proteins
VPVSKEYLAYVLEQLSGMGQLTCRRMFGGAGIYSGQLFFALVFRDQLYFKVDDGSRAEFEELGMEPFRPYAGKPRLSMTYYAVPVEVLEDSEELAAWGRRAVRAALNAARTKSVRPRSKPLKR